MNANASEVRMTQGPAINSVGEFLSHAIAIEHEAAERYQEFAEHMKDRAQDTAELFARLGRQGVDHARDLAKRARGIRTAPVDRGEYAWLDRGSPLPGAHEWLFRLMSPRDALGIAMHAEERAKRFFEHVVKTTADPGVMVLAQTFFAEEGEHIARMRRALERMPDPVLDWERIYAHGGPRRHSPRPAAPAGRTGGAAQAHRGDGEPRRKRAASPGKKARPKRRGSAGAPPRKRAGRTSR